jgi:hypothetical protein
LFFGRASDRVGRRLIALPAIAILMAGKKRGLRFFERLMPPIG